MDELEKIEMPVDIEDIGITFMYDFANLVSVSGFSTYTKNVIEFIETSNLCFEEAILELPEHLQPL